MGRKLPISLILFKNTQSFSYSEDIVDEKLTVEEGTPEESKKKKKKQKDSEVQKDHQEMISEQQNINESDDAEKPKKKKKKNKDSESKEVGASRFLTINLNVCVINKTKLSIFR